MQNKAQFEKSKKKYHKQWCDENYPITLIEDDAYKAGYFDCHASIQTLLQSEEMVEAVEEVISTSLSNTHTRIYNKRFHKPEAKAALAAIVGRLK